MPVSVIEVSQKDYDPPEITWSHADKTGKIAGYFVYIGKPRVQPVYATLGVVANLGTLAYFKYGPLFGQGR